MRHSQIIVILLFLIGLPGFSVSQTISFEHLDVGDGLSQNGIHSIAFDDFGNLWVGTLNGLNRYNGFEFEIYKSNTNDTTSISGNNIVSVCNAKDGDVWVATESGVINLYHANSNRFTRLDKKWVEGVNISRSIKMAEDENGDLWLVDGNRVLVINPFKNRSRLIEHQRNVRGFVEHDAKGILLYGDFGIEHLYTENYEIARELLLTGDVHKMSGTKDSIVCLQGTDVISLRNDLTVKNKLFSIERQDIARIGNMLLANNDIWMTVGNAIHIYESTPKGVQKKQISLNLSSLTSFYGRQITNMVADNKGNVWIGTYKNGLNYYSRYKNQFKHINWDYSNDISKTVEPVRAICKLSNNDVWFGFDSEGIGVIHPDGKQEYFDNCYDKNNKQKKIAGVRKILEDSDGNIFVGIRSGVCLYNRKQKRFDRLNIIFPDINFSNCYAIQQYDSTSVLIASNSGIYRISIGTKKAELLYDNLSGTAIRDIKVDHNKNIWAATDGSGLVFINGESGKSVFYNESNANITEGKIYSLEIDASNIWLATNSGLNQFNSITRTVEKVFLEEHGLSNNIVYSVDLDLDNNLWMSTNKGISKLDMKTQKISTFLNSYVFMDDAYLKGKDGTLYFGGYTGIVAFKPEDLKIVNNLPVPFVQQFELDGQIVNAGDTIGNNVLLMEKVNRLKMLELSYKQNNFSFIVNATPYEVPNNYIFRYKLSPWDKDWVYNKPGDLKLRFTNVQPGKYLLQVQVTDGTNNRSGIKNLEIVITPAVLEDLIFSIGSALCFGHYGIFGFQVETATGKKTEYLAG